MRAFPQRHHCGRPAAPSQASAQASRHVQRPPGSLAPTDTLVSPPFQKQLIDDFNFVDNLDDSFDPGNRLLGELLVVETRHPTSEH